MTNILVSLPARASTAVDPLDLYRVAHDAVLLVAPVAHPDAIVAVAKGLLQKGQLDTSTIGLIVLESDPVAKELRHLEGRLVAKT